MFIEKRYSNSLQSRRDDMCILDAQDKHIVPTKSTPNARLAFVGTKEVLVNLVL